MFKAPRFCVDLMNRLQARIALRNFKHLLNRNASNLAVQLTLTGALQPPTLTTRLGK